MKSLVFFALSLMVTGCAVARKENFDTSGLNSQASVKVISETANEEIVIEFVPSNGGAAASAQFGLIGALVGSAIDAGVNNSRAKSVEEKVQSFRAATSTLDMRQLLIQTLESGTDSLPWQGEKTFATDGIPPKGVTREFLASLSEQYLIQINTRYHFKPSLQVAELVTAYSVWDKTKLGKKAMIKPIYKNHVIYQSFPHNANRRHLTAEEQEAELTEYMKKNPTDASLSKNTRAKNQKKVNNFKAGLDKKMIALDSYTPDGQVWLQDEAKLLLAALTEGAQEVAEIVVADLSGALPLPEAAFDKKNNTVNHVVKTHENGRIVERSIHGGLISRDSGYPLYTVFD
jgi:hypothetical protein